MSLSQSVTFFGFLILCWVDSVGTQQIPEDSGDKHLEEYGKGPISTRVAPMFWCFETLLHSDTRQSGAELRFYCFQSVSAIRKS